MQKLLIAIIAAACLLACGNKKRDAEMPTERAISKEAPTVSFDSDSAYAYVKRQVDFGPRVPNTAAHRACGDWLSGELKRHGAQVTEQRATLTAFDGTKLEARNIFGQYNPDAKSRILLLAHWDSRPWADEDPDPAKRTQPVEGANDGASGVGVLLEIARQLNISAPTRGVDILFVDAEDWGTPDDEKSWALGTQYFMNHPVVAGYRADEAILLDMVGGKDAKFCREYFSEQSHPVLARKVWAKAAELGYGDMFKNELGGAITDDHVQLIAGGIPAIDIIAYYPDSRGGGFFPQWHTTGDTMEQIDAATLGAVGKTVMGSIKSE